MSNALFGSPARKTTAAGPDMSLRVQTSIVGQAIPVGWGQFRIACNLLDYQDFKATAVKSQPTSGKGMGGAFGKGTTGNVSYTYSAAVVAGICEGPITSVLQCWNSKTKQTLASLGLTAFLGTYAQTAWSYMSSAHPGNAIDYRGIAYVAAGPLQLGNTAQLPNFNFEIQSTFSNAISGLPDADPKDVVTDILTNNKYGVGFPVANLAALTTYSQYCRATGMVVSPVISQQKSAADFLTELAEGTNSNFRWSGSTLDCIPYGDTTITAHGSTYTAPSAPQYDITDADYIASQGEQPVKLTRTRPSDQYNLVRTRYLDRGNDYNEITVQAVDDAGVAQYGLRTEDPKSHSFLCDGAAAQMSCSLRLGRQQVRNIYTFTVGRRFIRLDAMDIVSINDSHLGLVAQWVRITEISENSDNTLTITAEEYLNGTGAAPAYPRQSNTGHVEDYHVAPGNVNVPVFCHVPIQIAPTGLELWMAVSGVDQVNWGGCNVWISYDNSTYQQVGTITGNCRTGVFTANYSSGSPMHLDFTESSGTIANVSHQAADKSIPLLALGNGHIATEIKSFGDATLISAYHYDCSYIYHGIYGTTQGSYVTGDKVAILDDQVFKFRYSKDKVGQTIYVKLSSFNRWGDGVQDLSACTAYSFVLSGPQTNFGPVAGSLGTFGAISTIKLIWTNSNNVGVDYIEVWRSLGAFGSAALLGQVAANITVFYDSNFSGANTGVNYYYWIRYVDKAGNPGNFEPSSGGAGVVGASAQAVTNDIANNNIITAHIVNNAATRHEDAESTGGGAPTASVWNTLQTVVHVSDVGNPIEISGQFLVNNTDNGAHHYQYRVQRGGVTVYPNTIPNFGLLNNAWTNQPINWVEAPAAGTYTYTLDWFPDSTALIPYNMIMSCDELKR